ncbi:uncharacterized protein METZ01_LOCUS370047, partial [marine metagenome]
MSSNTTFSLLGNPNCGKTAVFNLLTGLDQKVSNYPGITVERKIANVQINTQKTIRLEDFPGAYSIIPQSLDEKIVSDAILEWIKNPSSQPDGIIYVADITNLRRNLFFLTQLLPLNIPIILLLNMSDVVSQNVIDIDLLQKEMGIHKIISFSAAKKTGLDNLKNTLSSFDTKVSTKHSSMSLSNEYKKLVKPLTDKISTLYSISNDLAEHLSFSLLCNRKQL